MLTIHGKPVRITTKEHNWCINSKPVKRGNKQEKQVNQDLSQVTSNQ